MPNQRAIAADIAGRDEYVVMVRTSPNGQWVRVLPAREPLHTSPMGAQKALAKVLAHHEDEIAVTTRLLATPGTDEKQARRQTRLDALRRTEYRIFHRHVPPFAPLP